MIKHLGVQRLTKKTFSGRRGLLVAVAGLVCLLFLVGFLRANAVASSYQKQHAAYISAAKKLATRAKTASYSQYAAVTDPNNDDLGDKDFYKTSKQDCDTITNLASDVAGQKVPSLPSDVLTVFGTPFSSTYRSSHGTVSSLTAYSKQIATMSSHLQRVAHACKVYDMEYSNQTIDAVNRTARETLVKTTCTDGSGNCVEDSQVATYKNLYATAVGYAKAETATYKSNCNYPEMDAVCKQYEIYWQQGYQGDLAYYNALAPGADFGSAGDSYYKMSTEALKNMCTSLQKTQPALFAQVAASGLGCNTDNPETSINATSKAIYILMSNDEKAVHTAANVLTGLS